MKADDFAKKPVTRKTEAELVRAGVPENVAMMLTGHKSARSLTVTTSWTRTTSGTR